MADAPVFDWVAEELEKESDLDRLEARGTLRLALKAAGLRPDLVTPEQMAVVLARVIPGELAARGLSGAEALCASITARLGSFASGSTQEAPDAVFARLAGRGRAPQGGSRQR